MSPEPRPSTPRNSSTNVAIVHVLALEYYPPTTNLLDYLAADGTLRCHVFTTRPTVARPLYANPAIAVRRFAPPQAPTTAARRLALHIGFTLRTLWGLIRLRPAAVLYMEPHSAMPVYLYARYWNPRVKVLVHNHEYYTPQDFDGPGMRLVKAYHKREVRFLFRKAAWISQTNSSRRTLWLRDHPFVSPDAARVLPNYPPRSWSQAAARVARKDGDPVRCVHVGAVSLEDTYVREFCEWVARQRGAVTLDIYDYRIPTSTRTFLRELGSPHVRHFGDGVPYHTLPALLCKYHVGIVLHRGTTVNYVHNAPNKLFEYLACGLDVWFPEEVLGIGPYERRDRTPKVLALDFRALNRFDLAAAVARDGLPAARDAYFCEDVLPDLVSALRR